MVDGPHWVCHSPRWHVLPGSILLRLQGALQGRCPKWALHSMHFPGLNCSGSQVLHGGTDPDGLCVLCPSKIQAAYARPGAWLLLCPGWAVCLIHLPGPGCLVSQVCSENTVPDMPCVSSGELISDCDTPGRCQPSRIPGRHGQQLGACSVCWKKSLGPRLQQPLAFQLWLSHAYLSAFGEGEPYTAASSQLAVLWYSLNPLLCEHTRGHHVVLEPFEGKFFFFLSLWSPWFGLLSHISSLRLSSGNSGPVLGMSLHATSSSPLVVAVRHIFCGFCFFFSPGCVAL